MHTGYRHQTITTNQNHNQSSALPCLAHAVAVTETTNNKQHSSHGNTQTRARTGVATVTMWGGRAYLGRPRLRRRCCRRLGISLFRTELADEKYSLVLDLAAALPSPSAVNNSLELSFLRQGIRSMMYRPFLPTRGRHTNVRAVRASGCSDASSLCFSSSGSFSVSSSSTDPIRLP